MEHYNGLFGNYLTVTFSDVYPTYADFEAAYQTVGLALDDETKLPMVYALLTAEYKNSHIINSDITQFNFRLFSILWQHYPVWTKKLEYQKNIRDLGIDDLREGGKSIYNHSYNPSTAPSTTTNNELPTVDDQNVTKHTKSVMDAVFMAAEFLDANFTKEFLDKFRTLFIRIAEPSEPLWYRDIEGE